MKVEEPIVEEPTNEASEESNSTEEDKKDQ